MPSETYTVTPREGDWQVMQRKPGGKTPVCTTASRENAERIALALNVMPMVEHAAQELAEGQVGGAGIRALTQWYQQLSTRRRQQLVVGEGLSCLEGMGRLFITILLGISFVMGVLALVMWLVGK